MPSTFRGAEEASTNVELKACDATCNPYLALGGLIAAGLDGRRARARAARAGRRRPGDARRRRARAARDPPAAGDAGRGARRARGRRRAARRARAGAGRSPYLAVRRSEWAAYSAGGRGIRAAGSLREVLSAVALVDHHAHGILRAPPATLDEFRGLFSESADPRQWPHVATAVTYRRAIGVLAEHFGVEPDERAVFEHRLATDPAEYAARCCARPNTELLLIDDGFPPPRASATGSEMGELAGCRALPVLRIETRGARAAAETATARERRLRRAEDDRRLPRRVSTACPTTSSRALEANEATDDPLPVQVHCGFGDADLLAAARRPRAT